MKIFHSRVIRAGIQNGGTDMTKTYKIEVDCANCAEKMQDAANKTRPLKK